MIASGQNRKPLACSAPEIFNYSNYSNSYSVPKKKKKKNRKGKRKEKKKTVGKKIPKKHDIKIAYTIYYVLSIYYYVISS